MCVQDDYKKLWTELDKIFSADKLWDKKWLIQIPPTYRDGTYTRIVLWRVTIFGMATCIVEEKSVCGQLQPLLKGMQLCGAILTTLHLMPPNLTWLSTQGRVLPCVLSTFRVKHSPIGFGLKVVHMLGSLRVYLVTHTLLIMLYIYR